MHKLFLAVLALAAASLACGSSGSTQEPVVSTATTPPEVAPDATNVPDATATTAPTVGKVGETVTQGGYIVTLANVETATEFGDFAKADAGNIYVAAELVIESGADNGVFVNPLYASIKDANGYEYNSTLFGKEPALGSQTDLPRGEKSRGWVTFEVPEGATGLILSYQPLTVTNDIRIRFDLGR